MARMVAVMSLAIPLASSGIAGAAPGPGAGGWGDPASARVARTRRPGQPVSEVLGIRLGMSEALAQRRLALLGTRREIENEEAEAAGGESMEREMWTLRGSDLGIVTLGVAEGRVISIQAFARPGRRSIRYRDIGSLDQAQKLGFFIYLWTVPGSNDTPGLRVEARGVDPEYLGSYSITRERARTTEPARRAEEPAREGSE